MSIKSRILSILFWSVITAAFIGPGTVTTASSAGTNYGLSLIWAFVFSTFACIVLQEAAARITIASGLNLGQALWKKFSTHGAGVLISLFLTGIILFGSAAFEVGNILGSISGLRMVSDLPVRFYVVLVTLLAAFLLMIPSLQVIARLMGIIVAIMGIAFFITAIMLKPPFHELLKGSFVPYIPPDKTGLLLVLGLVGTTVVPYNLFLGSGISRKEESIAEMRFSLSVAIIFGGLISVSVLVAGTAVTSSFSFEAISQTLVERLGPWASFLFAIGLFAAGFTSAITAPLASAITAKSFFGNHHPEKWTLRSARFRGIWIIVLLTGFVFGWLEIKPIPAIILAQALNGVILPFVTIFMAIIMNDRMIIGEKHSNSKLQNLLLAIIVWVSLQLGLMQILNASLAALQAKLGRPQTVVLIVAILSTLASVILWINVLRKNVRPVRYAG